MFTDNERLIIRYLRDHPPADLGTIAAATGSARSSAYVALGHLGEIGVIENPSSGGGRSILYRVGTPQAIEAAGRRMLDEFRSAFDRFPSIADKPRLVFTDSYVLPESQLQELRTRFEVVTFDSSPQFVGNELLTERSRDADVIVRFDFGRIDAAFLEQTPRLQTIVCPNCVPTNIDFDACDNAGVEVIHADMVTEKYFAQTQLEYVLNALLTMLKPLSDSAATFKSTGNFYWGDHQGQELGGKRVGIVFGSSDISPMVQVFRSLGCEVAAANMDETPFLAAHFGLDAYRDLDALWDWAEIVLIVDPIDLDLSDRLTAPRVPRYFVITTSAVEYDLEVLREQILNRRIRGFAADYINAGFMAHAHEADPKSAVAPILDLPEVLITPEMSVISTESLARSHEQVFTKLMDLSAW